MFRELYSDYSVVITFQVESQDYGRLAPCIISRELPVCTTNKKKIHTLKVILIQALNGQRKTTTRQREPHYCNYYPPDGAHYAALPQIAGFIQGILQQLHKFAFVDIILQVTIITVIIVLYYFLCIVFIVHNFNFSRRLDRASKK